MSMKGSHEEIIKVDLGMDCGRENKEPGIGGEGSNLSLEWGSFGVG